jgi:ABC-type dipeptide/oligopeptide/nickel transport system permease subunit
MTEQATAFEDGAQAASQLGEFRQPARGFWLGALRSLVHQHPFEFFVSGGIIVVMLVVAIGAPWIATDKPNFQDATAVSQSPSWEHFFGTDNIGRDVFSRVAHGARVSLTVGLSAVALGIFAATVVGLVSGYAGRWVDVAIQRIVDIMMAFPSLILILLVVAVFGSSQRNVIFAIAIFIIAAPSRVVRAEVLSIKSRQYIEAARSVGCSNLRIMIQHILPNVVHVIIIMVSINVGGVIILEASLSFLGLGVPPPAASWGNMIAGPGTFYLRKAPWMILAPGAALALTVYAFNMLGDALRDVLDPRLRT